jgi:hypothetical protein
MADPSSTHTALTVNSLRATTSLSYLLLLTTTFFYAIHAPSDAHTPHGRFWTHNLSTPFAQSAIVTSIYWLVLFALQLSGAYGLSARNERYLTASINIGSHFVAHNLLLFGFVMLYVRGWYWISLLLLVINFFNLTTAYFRYPTSPRLLHIGAVSGPLAWNFAALYWVGATAVHTNHLAARIVANVFIWGWLGYGVFFLVAYKDYTMGVALSWLAFCKSYESCMKLDIFADVMEIATGLGQLLTSPHILQLQYVFAFTISGLLFVLSIAIGVPGLLGRDLVPRGQIVSEDQERAPLLADE